MCCSCPLSRRFDCVPRAVLLARVAGPRVLAGASAPRPSSCACIILKFRKYGYGKYKIQRFRSCVSATVRRATRERTAEHISTHVCGDWRGPWWPGAGPRRQGQACTELHAHTRHSHITSTTHRDCRTSRSPPSLSCASISWLARAVSWLLALVPVTQWRGFFTLNTLTCHTVHNFMKAKTAEGRTPQSAVSQQPAHRLTHPPPPRRWQRGCVWRRGYRRAPRRSSPREARRAPKAAGSARPSR